VSHILYSQYFTIFIGDVRLNTHTWNPTISPP